MVYNNYQDIPRFPQAYYSIDVDWRYLSSSLANLSGGLLDFDPPYQRGYVWTDAQRSRYIEYALMGGVSGRDIYFNCPSWRESRPSADVWGNTLELVDGKQRLDAVLGFMEGRVPAFGTVFGDWTGSLRGCDARLRVHVGCLQTKVEVVDWYLGMNNGGTAHTEADLCVALEYRASLLG